MRQLVADHASGGGWDLIVTPWLPDRVGDQATRETITRLASALGTDLAWREPAGR
jgi:arginase